MYDDNGVCKECSYKCLECTSFEVCSACSGNRHMEDFCECPSGTFDDGVEVCPNCRIECDECQYTRENCIICSGDLVDPPACTEPIPVAQSAVVEDVPVGSAKLITCAYNCETCSQSPGNCASCVEHRENAPHCTCVDGYYELNEACLPCDWRCPTCTATACTSCIEEVRILDDCRCPEYGYYELEGELC